MSMEFSLSDQDAGRLMPPSAISRTGSISKSVRQMASHTAGLVCEPRWPEAATGPIEMWEERVLESIPLTAFDSVSGARYPYSNIGFGTLGLALSRAAGRPFMKLVEEEIFTPLGMTGSTFVLGELEPRLAVGYASRPESMRAEATRSPTEVFTPRWPIWGGSWGR